MSVVAARSPAARPEVSELMARARAIGDLARERAQQTEADRRVGEDMIERMRQADLFRVMQPQAYGGFVSLPARDFYRIDVEARRPGVDARVVATFPHRHFQP